MTAEATDASPVVERAPHPAMGRRGLLMLFGLALVVRTLYCVLLLRHYVPVSDASDYYKIAVSVAHGKGIATTFPFGYEHATAFRPPLFPALLGGAFAVTGPSIGVAEAVNVLLGSVVVVLLAVLAARFGGARAGWLAGGIAVVYPPLLANDGPPLTESLALTLLLGGLLLLGRRRCLLAGLALGALVLTRPSAQLLVPVVAIWLLVTVGWRRTALFAAAVGLVVLPWVGRNLAVYGKPVLVTSNGFNLAAAYSEISLGQHKVADPVYDPRFDFLHTGAARTNEAALDAAFRAEGLKGIEAHPGEVPKVIWRNTRLLLDLSANRENGAERYDGRNLTLRFYALPAVWLMMLLGVAGLARLRGTRDGLLLGLVAAYFLLISVAAVSPPRLRAPLDVLFVLGTATLVTALLDRYRARRGATGGAAIDAAPGPAASGRPARVDA